MFHGKPFSLPRLKCCQILPNRQKIELLYFTTYSYKHVCVFYLHLYKHNYLLLQANENKINYSSLHNHNATRERILQHLSENVFNFDEFFSHHSFTLSPIISVKITIIEWFFVAQTICFSLPF